jgi:hypothetical protein
MAQHKTQTRGIHFDISSQIFSPSLKRVMIGRGHLAGPCPTLYSLACILLKKLQKLKYGTTQNTDPRNPFRHFLPNFFPLSQKSPSPLFPPISPPFRPISTLFLPAPAISARLHRRPSSPLFQPFSSHKEVFFVIFSLLIFKPISF